MSPEFNIRNSKNNQFYFNLKAGNGEIILTGETYTTKQNCINGINSVKINSKKDDNFEKRIGTRNDGTHFYRFNLKAGNGEIIGVSETYTSKQGRDNGIKSVQTNSPIAIVNDLT